MTSIMVMRVVLLLILMLCTAILTILRRFALINHYLGQVVILRLMVLGWGGQARNRRRIRCCSGIIIGGIGAATSWAERGRHRLDLDRCAVPRRLPCNHELAYLQLLGLMRLKLEASSFVTASLLANAVLNNPKMLLMMMIAVLFVATLQTWPSRLVMTTVMVVHAGPACPLYRSRRLVLGNEVLLEEELLVVARVAFALEIEPIRDRASATVR